MGWGLIVQRLGLIVQIASFLGLIFRGASCPDTYGNDAEMTFDPECTAIIGHTPPGSLYNKVGGGEKNVLSFKIPYVTSFSPNVSSKVICSGLVWACTNSFELSDVTDDDDWKVGMLTLSLFCLLCFSLRYRQTIHSLALLTTSPFEKAILWLEQLKNFCDSIEHDSSCWTCLFCIVWRHVFSPALEKKETYHLQCALLLNENILHMSWIKYGP